MRLTQATIISLLLVVALVLLQGRLWFASGGIIDMLRTKKQLAIQLQINDKLKKRNDKLVLQVQHLQTSKESVESRARGELGMVKKGEIFYQVVQ